MLYLAGFFVTVTTMHDEQANVKQLHLQFIATAHARSML